MASSRWKAEGELRVPHAQALEQQERQERGEPGPLEGAPQRLPRVAVDREEGPATRCAAEAAVARGSVGAAEGFMGLGSGGDGL